MYLCKDYMASTLQKLLIPIFRSCNLSIPLLRHFIKVPPHKYKHLVDWNNLVISVWVGTWHLNRPRHLFLSFCCTTRRIFEPCVYLSPVLIRINTVCITVNYICTVCEQFDSTYSKLMLWPLFDLVEFFLHLWLCSWLWSPRSCYAWVCVPALKLLITTHVKWSCINELNKCYNFTISLYGICY